MSKDPHDTRGAAGPRTESYDAWRPGGKTMDRDSRQSSSSHQDNPRSSRTQNPHMPGRGSKDSGVTSPSKSTEQRRSSATSWQGDSYEGAAAAERQVTNAAAYHLNGVAERPTDLEEPAISALDISHLVESLSETFKILIEQATDVSALRIKENNAKKLYSNRQMEFDKSREQHEKFPHTRCYQTDAKVQAEKVHRSIHDQMKQKTTALENLAAEAAQTLIPGLVGLIKASGVSTEQRKLDNRCIALERQLESQRKDIELLSRSNKNLEEKQTRMKLEEQKWHSDHDKQLERELRGVSAKIYQLSNDVKVAVGKGDAVEGTLTELSTAMSQKSDAVKSISSEVNKLAALRPELDNFKQGVDKQLSQLFEQTRAANQTLSDGAAADLKGAIVKLAKQQTATCDGLSTMIDKKAVYQQKEVDLLKQELKRVEHSLRNSPIVTEIVSDLKEQKQKIREIESNKATIPTGLSSKLETMDAMIQQQRLDIDDMKAGEEEIQQTMATIVTDMIGHAITSLSPQIQALQSKTSGLEAGYVALGTLPSQFKLLQDSQQVVVQKLYQEISTIKNAPASLSSREVVEIVRAEPGLFPDQTRTTKAIHDLNQQMVAANENLENVHARINNINTAALAAYMTDQLLERFPNVHAIDLSIKSFNTDISQIQASISQMMENIQSVQKYNSTLQTQESAAAQIQEVHKSIGDLDLEVSSAMSVSKADRENVHKFSEQQNNLKREFEQRVETINVQIKDLYSTLDRYQVALDELANKKPTASPAMDQHSTPNGQKIPIGSNRLPRKAGTVRPSPNRSSNRDISAASSSNKKRKLSNGHSNSNYHPTSHQRGNKSSRGILQQLSTDESDHELIQPGLQSDDEDQ